MEINKSFKVLNIDCFKTKLGSRILLKKYRTVDNRFMPKAIQTPNATRSNLES